MRRVAALIMVISIALPAASAGAEVTRQQLSEARAKVSAKSQELEGELTLLDRNILQQQNTTLRIARVEAEIIELDRQIALTAFIARERAVDMYVSVGAVETMLTPEAITQLGTRSAYLDALVDQDREVVNQFVRLQEDRRNLTVELEGLRLEQEALGEEIARAVEVLMAELEVVDREYQALRQQWEREEAERIRRAAAAAAAAARAAAARSGFASSAHIDPSGRTCPVVGAHTFRDSWLEPRPYRGGVHRGTDLIASSGTPLVAMENGTVLRTGWHWAGGNGLYLRGDSGDVYYYAHLNSYAPGIGAGIRVGVAQIIAYVGSTGASTIPHLHLGYQPGGGPLTNPYQLLVKLCR